MIRCQSFQILRIIVDRKKWSSVECLFHKTQSGSQYWQSQASGSHYGIHRFIATANQSFPYATKVRCPRRIELPDHTVMCQTEVKGCLIPFLGQFLEFTRKTHEASAVVTDDYGIISILRRKLPEPNLQFSM